jgi:hypothetical protein
MIRKLAVIAASLVGLAIPSTALASTTRPLPPVPCTAWVSNSHPQDYSTDTVYVDTRASDETYVTTVADYRTSRSVHYTTDPDSSFYATTSYNVANATPGYRVRVQVYVKVGNRTGYCTTAFTPVRRTVPRTTVYPSQTACNDTPLITCSTVAGSFANEYTALKEEPVYVHITSVTLKTTYVWINYCGKLDTSWTMISLPAVINVPESSCENVEGDGWLFIYTDFPVQVTGTQPVSVQLTSSS